MNNNEINQIIVNGHSLGGAAYMTVLLLYDTYQSKINRKQNFSKFLILGYAPGTTVADQSTGSINKYISNNRKLNVLSFK